MIWNKSDELTKDIYVENPTILQNIVQPLKYCTIFICQKIQEIYKL